VSFGGVVAAAFNQRHPTRVSGLAFVSALPPSWRPDDRVRAYLRWPRLLLPLFLVGSFHLYREISVAAGGGFAAVRAAARQAWQALRHFPAPARMAARAGFVAQAQVDAQGSRHVPVLIVTGEARLERVVPPRLTAEYATIWPQARSVTLERTGHLGLVTRPAAFADVLVPFVEGCERAAEETRRRVG
jgi:pimeloyl-ACP methyl ester carboxylesterase